MTAHLCQWPDCDKKATLYTHDGGGRTLAACVEHAGKVEKKARLRSHELAILQLRDWLTDPKIVRALLTTRTATRDGLRTFYNRLDEIDEAGAWAITAVLCKDKRVRRVMASHASKTLGISKEAALKGLLEFSQIGRGESAGL